MRKQIGRNGLFTDLAAVAVVLVSGCTGTVSGTTPPGGGTASGGATNTKPGGSGGSGGGNSPSGSGSGGSGGTSSGTGATTATPATGSGGTTVTLPGGGTRPAGLWDNITATTTLDAGRVTLRRLNVNEYDNSVRDIFGTMTSSSQKYMFPEDQTNEGFDNNGQTLVYSDLLFAQVQASAVGVVTEFLARPATDPVRTRILTCTPTIANMATCMTTILKPLMANAFRRPVTDAEVAQVVTVATTIATAHMDPMPGLSAALQSVLLSPNFLFLPETSVPATSTAATKINDYELAARLSYFLGSTTPDAQLTAAAAAGKLVPAGADYTSQVNRLLTDTTRLQAFTNNFAAKWLSLSDTQLVAPDDPALMANFDDTLRLSMPLETTAFFSSLVSDNQPLTSLLTANFTFVNARLAKQYGLAAPAGAGTALTKVTLPSTSNRMGILTQASYLTITSLPARTSPVKRGVWVLENLLCDGTAAPPSGVPQLPPEGMGTVRQVLEMHRASAYCSSCHSLIDPIGLALENYDAVGAYRTQDNGIAVDASSVMPDQTMVNGAASLSNYIAKDTRLTRCLTKQMMTFGVGRIFDYDVKMRTDRAYIMGLADPLASSNATWQDLVRTVAASEAFRTNRGEGP